MRKEKKQALDRAEVRMIRRNRGAQHFDGHPVSKQDIRWIQQMKLFVCWDETIHVKIVERMLSIRLKDG